MSQTYIFHRVGSFYSIDLSDDAHAVRDAENNPGTLKVTDAQGSRTVWEAKQEAPAIAPTLTLRKVEEKELIDGQDYLIKSENTKFAVFSWWSKGRKFEDNEGSVKIEEVTAIYELPTKP